MNGKLGQVPNDLDASIQYLGIEMMLLPIGKKKKILRSIRKMHDCLSLSGLF